jgi:hypothetical protein
MEASGLVDDLFVVSVPRRGLTRQQPGGNCHSRRLTGLRFRSKAASAFARQPQHLGADPLGHGN